MALERREGMTPLRDDRTTGAIIGQAEALLPARQQMSA
jgi:hypothetical protein